MKVEFYRDRNGEYRWRLRHRNGNILADSAEGYSRKDSCIRGWHRIAVYVGTKPVPVVFVK